MESNFKIIASALLGINSAAVATVNGFGTGTIQK